MLAIGFDTKKELKLAVGTNIQDRIIETSIFGAEYSKDMIGSAVVVSRQPDKIRKSFAQIWVKDHILTKVS
ncbi:hypothetical protein CMI37_27775 [Candidatus Pacearchaeota archaeon]|nr:hypothetical protein [Candidatus Pacearchaeota archaeon]|tara:strand:- start:1419 stop:1631 length:213 start_codon:yes stop_codon:yes gene_type:complete